MVKWHHWLNGQGLQITSLQQEGEELSGQARCPFDATQSNVAVFAGVHLGM